MLGALAALVWGGADYCGGRAARSASAITVTVFSQLAALPVLGLLLLVISGTFAWTDAVWSAGAGVFGLCGIVLLYRGLATGRMSVVAPTTAVTGAAVPLLIGLTLLGESPSTASLAGVGCAVVAIALVSLTPDDNGGRSGAAVIGVALAAGVFFGLFYVLFAQVRPDAGAWPLLVSRLAAIPLGLVVIVASRTPGRLPAKGRIWAALAGCGDVTANAFYLLGVTRGLLSVVAPIAALYPVSTVLLALLVDRERVRRAQVAGLGLAAVALLLTAM